jgi:hypothetical protein
MSFIIGLIIFVFDPLAVSLILAGNYLVEKRVSRIEKVEDDLEEIHHELEVIEHKLEEPIQEPIIEEPPVIKKDNVVLELEDRDEKIEPIIEPIPEPELEPVKEVEVEITPEPELVFHSLLKNTNLDKSDVIPSEENTTPILKYYQR